MIRLLSGGEVSAVVESLAPGAEVWLPGLGASLWPLLRTGDAVRVRRVDEKTVLREGQLAVCLDETGRPLVHVVLSVQPLRTASLRGVVERPERAVGIVTQLRRGQLRLRASTALAAALWGMTSAASFARTQPQLRGAWSFGVDSLTGPLTADVRRRWLGEWTVRALRATDAEALLRFGGDHLALDPRTLQQRLVREWDGSGAAIAAFTGSGGIAGFGYLGAYRDEGVDVPGTFIRHLKVRSSFRHLGVGRAVVRALCERARGLGLAQVYADVRADHAASLRLFHAEGFHRAQTDESDHTARKLCNALGGPMVLLERRVGSA